LTDKIWIKLFIHDYGRHCQYVVVTYDSVHSWHTHVDELLVVHYVKLLWRRFRRHNNHSSRVYVHRVGIHVCSPRRFQIRVEGPVVDENIVDFLFKILRFRDMKYIRWFWKRNWILWFRKRILGRLYYGTYSGVGVIVHRIWYIGALVFDIRDICTKFDPF
jgi:hypothetical protein